MSIVFGFLKKKITGFIDKLTGKEEAKEAVEIKEPILEEKKESAPVVIVPPLPREEKQSVEIIVEKEPKKEAPLQKKEKEKSKKEEKQEVVHKETKKPEEKKETLKKEPPYVAKKETPKSIKKEEKSKEKEEVKKTHSPEVAPPKKLEAIEKEESISIEIPEIKKELSLSISEKQKDRQVKTSIFSTLKSVVTGEIEIKEHEVKDMLESLELELIESDVALEVAEQIKKELSEKLIGKKVKKGAVNEIVKQAIESTLLTMISTDKGFDLITKINSLSKPVKIMFVGTNGSGKTTTIAKVAHLFKRNNHSVVLAAADTFRAAAIEQLATHAQRLDVKIIKRDYGADPTAVAYDAVSYATAHEIEVVLIDTAGRQETNFNLLSEMKKMKRVIKPDITLFLGESITGNAILSQITEFNKEIGLDGVILTKLDCDAKGGTVLSISKVTGLPILYLGTGQKYDDLEQFNAQEVVNRILS